MATTEPRTRQVFFYGQTPSGAHCREDDQGGAFFNALHGGQGDPCQAREGGTGVKTRFIAFLVAAGCRRERLTMTVIRTGPEVCLEVLIAHGQLLGRKLLECDGLL
jgi:hypothetical protein